MEKNKASNMMFSMELSDGLKRKGILSGEEVSKKKLISERWITLLLPNFLNKEEDDTEFVEDSKD